MGNANEREDGANDGIDDLSGRSNGGELVVRGVAATAAAVGVRVPSSDSMANTPPQSPRRSRSPLLFAPQNCANLDEQALLGFKLTSDTQHIISCG